MLKRGFHALIKNALFPSLTDVGSHKSPPFGAQRPRWHLLPSPTDVGPPILPPFGAQRSHWHTAWCPPPSRFSLLTETLPGLALIPFLTAQAYH